MAALGVTVAISLGVGSASAAEIGRYNAALIAPTFANPSVHAQLSTATGRGGTVDASGFGVGDLWVLPIWLG